MVPSPSTHPFTQPVPQPLRFLLSGLKLNLKLILEEINLEILDSIQASLDALEIIKAFFFLTSIVPFTLRNTLNLAQRLESYL